MQNNCLLKIDTTTAGLYDIKKIVYDPTFTMFVDTAYAIIDSLVSCPGMTYNYSNFSGSISPCITLDIDKEEFLDIQIYPTNTNGEINIQTSIEEFDVDVYNIVGQKILHASNKKTISIGGNSAGMYLVTILNGNNRVFTQKVFLSK